MMQPQEAAPPCFFFHAFEMQNFMRFMNSNLYFFYYQILLHLRISNTPSTAAENGQQ
jgi:hypothetical protein